MDRKTILDVLEFSRGRLLGILDAIEKSGQDMGTVLAWRPGKGRAHIGWQAMHCAATHDKYLNQLIRGEKVSDEQIVKDFGGGSTPSDENVPTLPAIREKLAKNYQVLKDYIPTADVERKHKLANGNERSVGESLVLLAWHEAHHQGQIHLTWNLYKAAHGMV